MTRNFKRPVNWLLGRQMLATLKETLLYAAYGDKMDPKDWMSPNEVSFDGESYQSPFPKGEFWFDYISDTGDGMRAVYSLACLCMSELYLNEKDGDIGFAGSLTNAQSTPLRRGAFLFVGGDTSYHVADYATLAERFQQPFNWAFDDLGGKQNVKRRLLFGVPGNHDYYDNLHGFNRQFRKPFLAPWQQSLEPCTPGTPLLDLKGFEREQQASYVAIALPFGWALWGLDAQSGQLDFRQTEFFLSRPDEERKKLIIAMPEPTTVFSRAAGKDSPIVKTFRDLDNLPVPFLEDGRLDPQCCRLDLAGDVHHYARYWGDDSHPNYASVVSGAGGAFLHPSHTRLGGLEANSLYPPQPASHREVTRKLLNPWNLIWKGYVWLIGALVALTFYFGFIIVPSSRQTFQAILEFLKVGLHLADFAPNWSFINQVGERIPQALNVPVSTIILNLAGLALGAASAWLTWRVVNRAQKGIDRGKLRRMRQQGEDGEKAEQLGPQAIVRWTSYWPALGLPLALGAFILGWWMKPDAPLPAALSSTLVFLFAVLGGVALCLARRYSDTFLSQARLRRLERMDRPWLWVIASTGLGLIFFGCWFYGTYPAVLLVGDMLFLAVLSGLLLGLPAMGWKVGAKYHGWLGKAGFALLGLWHALLQISIPLLLSLHFFSSTFVLAVLVAAAVHLTAILVFCQAPGAAKGTETESWQKVQPWIAAGLLLTWLALGSLLMWWLWPSGSSAPDSSWPENFLALVLVVGSIGALSSCAWFGWYLAVALAFNGHNNEAGGAARVEKYKQFIRFKLAEDTLTGYVIAIDEPRERPTELRPRLVDKFQIKAPR